MFRRLVKCSNLTRSLLFFDNYALPFVIWYEREVLEPAQQTANNNNNNNNNNNSNNNNNNNNNSNSSNSTNSNNSNNSNNNNTSNNNNNNNNNKNNKNNATNTWFSVPLVVFLFPKIFQSKNLTWTLQGLDDCLGLGRPARPCIYFWTTARSLPRPASSWARQPMPPVVGIRVVFRWVGG